MVGDDRVDAARTQHLDLHGVRYPAVDRDDQRGVHADHTLERRLGETVALGEPVWHRRVHVGAQRLEPESGGRCGRDPVEVEVAEDNDALTALDRAGDPVGRCGHTGNVGGLRPVTIERWLEECANTRQCVDMAGHENARRDER